MHRHDHSIPVRLRATFLASHGSASQMQLRRNLPPNRVNGSVARSEAALSAHIAATCLKAGIVLGSFCVARTCSMLRRECRDLPRFVPKLYRMAVHELLSALLGLVVVCAKEVYAVLNVTVQTKDVGSVAMHGRCP